MKKMLIIFSLLFVMLIASLSVAGHHYKGYHHQGYHGMMPSTDMKSMDSNEDGNLTFEEYSNQSMKQLRAGFDMIDTNKDGVIGADEWKTLLEVHGIKSE